MPTESLNSHLIKNPDLLQSLVSGVRTCNNKRMDYVINLSKQTPKSFQVSGGHMPYNTREGKVYARNLLYVLNHPIYSKFRENKESNHVTQ
jgi:hypothetical protein